MLPNCNTYDGAGEFSPFSRGSNMHEPLNLLVLCHEYPPVGGGAGAACATLSEQFVAAGHHITVLTMGYGDLPVREVRQGVTIERIPSGRRRREMASPLEALVWAERCRSRVQQLHASRPFDAVHAHFIMPAGIVAARFKRQTGVPFVITPHGSDVPGFNRERLKLAHLFARPWWVNICRAADRIVSPSSSLLQLIEESAGEVKSTIIPHAAVERFQPAEKEQRILLCSRLVERKGLHRFLLAVAGRELPGWEIDIVGTGPMFERLRMLAGACRVPVHLHGWLDNSDPRLSELYGRAAIFALPSERENFPVSLLEAMAAECAVIATDAPGNPEVLGNTGCLIPVNDVSQLQTAVMQLTQSSSRRRELGQQARQRVLTEFAPQEIARRYLDVFAQCRQSAQERGT